MYTLLFLLLILLGYFVIIIGFTTLASFHLDSTYKDYLQLRALTYSGIWLAFKWIKENPMSPLSPTTKAISAGNITYEVIFDTTTTRIINVTSTLMASPQTFMAYQGTAVINTSTGDIISLEGTVK